MPRHECDRSLFGDHCSICEHDAGYREGHADGVAGKERVYLFVGRHYQWAKGYATGYVAGATHKRYAEDHQC